MLTIEKILLPVDFSDRCGAAARYAACLAAHFGSGITLLHVPEGVAATVGKLSASHGYIAPAPAYRFEGELAAFANTALPGIETRREIAAGDPAELIASFAHTLPADLIVMPTHGRSPVPRFILGSVTAKVLHSAECVVCTSAHWWCDESGSAPAPAAALPAVMICAVDLGPASAGVIAWAASMAASCRAGLVLVHATDGEPAAEIERLLRENAAGVDARVWIESGEPVRVVCEAVERFGAGALVIGRSAEKGLRLRANAYAIIRHSPCPVFSI